MKKPTSSSSNMLFFIDDGAVRLWKNYDGSEQEEAQLVSAWRALKDMEKSSMQQSGLVCDWHQERATLFTGGDARLIKVWDVQQEMPIMVSFVISFLAFTNMCIP